MGSPGRMLSSVAWRRRTSICPVSQPRMSASRRSRSASPRPRGSLAGGEGPSRGAGDPGRPVADADRRARGLLRPVRMDPVRSQTVRAAEPADRACVDLRAAQDPLLDHVVDAGRRLEPLLRRLAAKGFLAYKTLGLLKGTGGASQVWPVRRRSSWRRCRSGTWSPRTC